MSLETSILEKFNQFGNKAVGVINDKVSKIKPPKVETEVGLEPGVMILAVVALLMFLKK